MRPWVQSLVLQKTYILLDFSLFFYICVCIYNWPINFTFQVVCHFLKYKCYSVPIKWLGKYTWTLCARCFPSCFVDSAEKIITTLCFHHRKSLAHWLEFFRAIPYHVVVISIAVSYFAPLLHNRPLHCW
jgi:hypothetical protein